MSDQNDIEFRLNRCNKQELRDIIRTYRFLALSLGVKLEELSDIEKESIRVTQKG